ncbi:MAG: hypothetical protein LLG00_04160 [Planctomycetaceae bacterium]|nr:hypothetical protein [Planctomycetaceae bacterium]
MDIRSIVAVQATVCKVIAGGHSPNYTGIIAAEPRNPRLFAQICGDRSFTGLRHGDQGA